VQNKQALRLYWAIPLVILKSVNINIVLRKNENVSRICAKSGENETAFNQRDHWVKFNFSSGVPIFQFNDSLKKANEIGAIKKKFKFK